MNNRKLLAVILSLTLLVGILPMAGLSFGASAEETVCTVYVSASGDDSAAGTEGAPLATLAAAVSAIEADAATRGVIKVIGTFPVAKKALSASIASYQKEITVEGADSSAVFSFSENQFIVVGPMMFQNIKLSGKTAFVCQKNTVQFGSGVDMDNDSANPNDWPTLYTGNYGAWQALTNPQKEVVTLDSVSFYSVWLGNYASHKDVGNDNISSGIEYVQNGGSLARLIIGAGGANATYCKGNSYKGNVNITINGGFIGTSEGYGGVMVFDDSNVTGNGYASTFNSNAVQIIFNNGTIGNVRSGVVPTVAEVEAKNGKLYMLKCAAQEGSALETTAAAGTYKVNGDMVAVATAEDGTIHKSAGGYLTVPAGVYTVTWMESTEPKVVYVDAANGSDTNDGAQESPFATINAAITALNGVTNPYGKIVRIIGAYTVDAALALTAHTDMITIEGASGTNATLTLNKHISTIGGPLTVDNIALAGTGTFRARTFKLIFGSGVTYNTSTSKASLPNITTGATYGGHVTTAGSVEELTVNGGGYSTIYLGNAAVTSGKHSPSGGVEFVMNGGYFYKLYIGTDGWDAWPGGTSFEGDVNVTINGGSFGLPSNTAAPGGILVVDSTVVADTKFNGNAVQFLFNNGTAGSFTEAMLPLSSTVKEFGGEFYMLKAEKGVSLATTAQAGVYTVANEANVVATNVDTGVETPAVNGTLTVVPGTYTVKAVEATTDGLVTVDKGDTDATFTDTAGTVHVTAPDGKLAYAVSEDGKTIYIANNKTTIGSDKTPNTNYENTKYTDWCCFDLNGSYLVNTYKKLTRDEELNVVYFGGSLTAGYGCGESGDPNGVKADGITTDAYSWRGLSGQWLQNNFPEATINLVNCAIGESGTYLGTFRVKNDIIAAAPDLLFVEYAINDCYHGSNKTTAALQLETIVREVKSALPTCDIVIVLTTDKTYMSTTYSGGLFAQAQGHYEIAEAYGLPVMNIGMGLAKGIAEAENNAAWWNDSAIWSKYFCDPVHPYSTGHEQYYLCVKEFLENNLLRTNYSGLNATTAYYPPVQSEYLFDGNRVTLYGADMQTAVDTANSTGVTYNSGVVPGGLGSSQSAKEGYYSVAADGKIVINFTGTEIALWTKFASGGTTYTYSIDGGAEKTMAQSSHSPTVFAKGLDSKAHTLTLSGDAILYIVGIFSRDATKQTVQGTKFTYADGRVGMVLTLPAGSYTIGYAATVGELPIPAVQIGVDFVGWANENGDLLDDSAALTAGMILTAKDTMGIYVDATNGSDENDGLTETTAVATLNKAIELIEASNSASGIVTIIGTVDNPGALANHSKMITFRGQTPATDGILNVNGMRLHGPTTFENIKLTNGAVRADGYELVFGENVTMPQYPYVGFYSGTYDSSNTTRRDTVTVGSGRFHQAYLGPFYCAGAAESTLGVDYVQTGGTVTFLNLGGDAWSATTPVFYETIYKGDVNISINGGQVGEIVVLKPISDSNGNRVNRDTVFEGAVQILVNGEGYMTNALPAIDAAGGVWVMNGRNDGGYALEVTDKAGTFTVNTADVTAIAYDAAGNIYKSEGGTLTVPAGVYTVEYQTSLSYTNTGSKIKFYADTTVDFAALAHDEPDGQMFVGWVDAEGNAPADNTFAVGDVLTAKYVAYDEDDFAFLGSSIRFSDDKAQKDLRYMFQLNNVLKNSELITDVSFGAVAIPNSMLTVNNAAFTTSAGEVKLGGVYRYNGKNYNVAQVKAEKLWATTDDGVQYTLCLTGIKAVQHETRYVVRGYMTYTDMNGVAQVLYSAEASESLVSTAKRVLTDLGVEGGDAVDFAALIANAKAALQQKYTADGSTAVSIDVSTAPSGSDGTNGIVLRSDGTRAETFYKLAGSGLIVRDVVLDGVGDAFSEEVNVIQITDPHLHAYNDEDIADANPTVLASKQYRTHNNLNYSFDYGQKAIINLINAMEYASAYGSQTMVTGDVIDALTLGSLELMDRYIEIAYPEAINLLGNHEPVRQWQHDVVDASSLDSRYAVLQENWNHDVYYTYRVVEDKVMVIQLDNGQEKFWASQQPKLAADLATARENGYTVLVFTHVPLSTLDSADTAVVTLYGADAGNAYDIYNKGVGKSDSTGVMDLIVNNADIIKGVFNGHTHSDYYTEIAAKTADGTATVIPQYTLHGNFYENGNVLKITVQ